MGNCPWIRLGASNTNIDEKVWVRYLIHNSYMDN